MNHVPPRPLAEADGLEAPAESVSAALETRFSVRAFTDRPVDPRDVRTIVARAAHSPSGGNVQPWFVYAVAGEPLAQFRAVIAERSATNPKGEALEYNVYPPKLKEPYRTRRYRCGEDLYASIDSPREDRAGRLAQYGKNLDFFGAPVALFFALDRDMGENQWAHLGMYMQSVMLLAREFGLHTCAQEIWAHWLPTCRELLRVPDEQRIYCGMALGYADGAAAINHWRTDRAPLEEWARFEGLD
ncbi:MAG: nitroreductase [Pseudomonadota bacterium]